MLSFPRLSSTFSVVFRGQLLEEDGRTIGVKIRKGKERKFKP